MGVANRAYVREGKVGGRDELLMFKVQVRSQVRIVTTIANINNAIG
jgi:hypothetical protein